VPARSAPRRGVFAPAACPPSCPSAPAGTQRPHPSVRPWADTHATGGLSAGGSASPTISRPLPPHARARRPRRSGQDTLRMMRPPVEFVPIVRYRMSVATGSCSNSRAGIQMCWHTGHSAPPNASVAPCSRSYNAPSYPALQARSPGPRTCSPEHVPLSLQSTSLSLSRARPSPSPEHVPLPLQSTSLSLPEHVPLPLQSTLRGTCLLQRSAATGALSDTTCAVELVQHWMSLLSASLLSACLFCPIELVQSARGQCAVGQKRSGPTATFLPIASTTPHSTQTMSREADGGAGS
jgi:hypothetical protein